MPIQEVILKRLGSLESRLDSIQAQFHTLGRKSNEMSQNGEKVDLNIHSIKEEMEELKRGQSSITLAFIGVTNKQNSQEGKITTLQAQVGC